MHKKYIIAAILFVFIGVTACSTPQEEANVENEPTVEEALEPEVEEPVITTAEHILGSWAKIAQSCDAEGNNCKESSGSDWVFDGTKVSLGRVQQPYHVSNDTIYIVDSPYVIAKEWGDTLLLHGVAQDRFMKLVRK